MEKRQQRIEARRCTWQRCFGRRSSQPRANSVKGPDGVRKSETINPWISTDCPFWKKGHCKAGIKCAHRHEGFAIANADGLVDKCFVCDKPGHHSSERWAPGGGKDPKSAEHWAEYQKLKRATGT